MSAPTTSSRSRPPTCFLVLLTCSAKLRKPLSVTTFGFHGRWYCVQTARLCLAKYLSLFDGKYRQKCLQPCRDLRLRLNPELCLDLCLDLNLNLNPLLFRTLFEALFQLSFASPFGSVFASKNPPLRASPYPALRRQRLPRGRPVGRPLPGRIVAAALGHTTGCSLGKRPDIYTRMIRVLIERVVSSLRIVRGFRIVSQSALAACGLRLVAWAAGHAAPSTPAPVRTPDTRPAENCPSPTHPQLHADAARAGSYALVAASSFCSSCTVLVYVLSIRHSNPRILDPLIPLFRPHMYNPLFPAKKGRFSSSFWQGGPVGGHSPRQLVPRFLPGLVRRFLTRILPGFYTRFSPRFLPQMVRRLLPRYLPRMVRRLLPRLLP
jgi:hypothetical protein